MYDELFSRVGHLKYIAIAIFQYAQEVFPSTQFEVLGSAHLTATNRFLMITPQVNKGALKIRIRGTYHEFEENPSLPLRWDYGSYCSCSVRLRRRSQRPVARSHTRLLRAGARHRLTAEPVQWPYLGHSLSQLAPSILSRGLTAAGVMTQNLPGELKLRQ